MRISWHLDPQLPDDRLAAPFERERRRLERRLGVFSPELVHLAVRGDVVGPAGQRGVEIGLELKIPRAHLAARARAKDAVAALHEAFAKLRRQVEEEFARRRREPIWKRPARREAVRREVRAVDAAAAAEAAHGEHPEAVADRLDALWNRTRRELAVLLAQGDLDPDLADTTAVIDTAVVRALDAWNARPEEIGLDAWLWSFVREEILDRVARTRERRRAERLEESVPAEDEARAVSTLGDEILDFYQPDEALRLEDIVPEDVLPTPEEAASRRELGRWAIRALADLPHAWREAFVLWAIDGWAPEEISWLVGRPLEEIRADVASARRMLRERLREAGKTVAVPAVAGREEAQS